MKKTFYLTTINTILLIGAIIVLGGCNSGAEAYAEEANAIDSASAQVQTPKDEKGTASVNSQPSSEIAEEEEMKEDAVEDNSSSNNDNQDLDESVDNLKSSYKGLKKTMTGSDGVPGNKLISCGWCGNKFKASEGWFHNEFLSQGEIECMQYNDFVMFGSPTHCSKRCCVSDN